MQQGASYALKTFGSQDVWVNSLSNETFDSRKVLLKDCQYQRVYKKLYFKNNMKHSKNKYIYIIDSICDLINNVDVYIPRINNFKLNELVYSIEITFGGQRIDKIYATHYKKDEWLLNKKGDIETLLNTSAELIGSRRKVEYTDTHIIVPLHLAPLHDSNLVLPSCEWHDMEIIIEGSFSELYNPNDFQIYANCYYVENNKKHQIHDRFHEFPTYQNITYSGDSHVLKNGINKFKLNFNHPVHCIYFWGFDKTKIKRITLTLNDYTCYNKKPEEVYNTDYYDDTIIPLEYYKKSRGISAEPVVIFFSETSIYERPKSTINFSRLDYPILTIETEQEDESEFYLNGINIQAYRCSNGMFGLVYSK